VAPDVLGAPGMVQAQEFSQAQPRIPASAQWQRRTPRPPAPGPGPVLAFLLAEPLYGTLGWPQTAWVRRGWARPKSFPRRNRGFRPPHTSRVHSEVSRTRAWPRAGVLALGAALRGPGVAPDGLGAPRMGQTQEFSQDQPRIPGSAQWLCGVWKSRYTLYDSGLRTVAMWSLEKPI
jgi:hypothetical protein